jgi:hypothetical protein
LWNGSPNNGRTITEKFFSSIPISPQPIERVLDQEERKELQIDLKIEKEEENFEMKS